MTIDRIQKEIHEFVIAQLNDGIFFDSEANLIQQSLIDSMRVMKLINFLENNFNIEVDLVKIKPDNFQTIKTIADLVYTSKN